MQPGTADKKEVLSMNLYDRHAELKPLQGEIERAAEAVVAAYRAGRKVLLCGNGGSAADCEHISGELIKEFKIKRPIDPAVRGNLERAGAADIADNLAGGICSVSLLSQSAIFTALCNDVGYEYAFAQQVYAMGAAGDVLFAFSTSGNSKAVVNAAITAHACGMTVVGFTGQGGGKLLPCCDIRINVPETETYLVQELHLPVYHEICARAEQMIWGAKE